MNFNDFLQSRPTSNIPRTNEGQYLRVREVVFELLTVLTDGKIGWNGTYLQESLTEREREFLIGMLKNSTDHGFEWKAVNNIQQLFKVKVYEGLESKGDTLTLHQEYDLNFPRRTNFLGKFKYDDMKEYMYRWQGKNKYTTKVYRASENGWDLEFSFE